MLPYSPANQTLTCESLVLHENMLLCISGWEATESLGMELAVCTWLQLLTVHTSKVQCSHSMHSNIYHGNQIIMMVNNLGGRTEVLMKLCILCCLDSTAMPLYPRTLAFWPQRLSLVVLTWLLQVTNSGVRRLWCYNASWSPPLTAISVRSYDCHGNGVSIF